MNFSKTNVCINCGKTMESGGGEFSPEITNVWRSCTCGMKAIFYNVEDEYEVNLRVRHKDYEAQNPKKKLRECLSLADIQVLEIYEIVNGYVGERGHPWLLVKTPHGLLKLGWRKRVINLDWTDTDYRGLITEDVVTKGDTMVHAGGYGKLVEYLTTLKGKLRYKKPERSVGGLM